MIIVDGEKFDKLDSLARYVAKNGQGKVEGGDTVKEKQQAAAVVKNTPTYVALFSPRSPGEWRHCVNWCIKAG